MTTHSRSRAWKTRTRPGKRREISMKRLGKERIDVRDYANTYLFDWYDKLLTVYERAGGERVVHYVTGYRKIHRDLKSGRWVLVIDGAVHTPYGLFDPTK